MRSIYGPALALAAAGMLAALPPDRREYLDDERDDLDGESLEPMTRPFTAAEREAFKPSAGDLERMSRAEQKRLRRAAKRLALATR